MPALQSFWNSITCVQAYNPISKDRTWQLAQAKEILLKWRKAETLIVLARLGQQVQVKSLIDLAIDDVDMHTVILIGSSQTSLVLYEW